MTTTAEQIAAAEAFAKLNNWRLARHSFSTDVLRKGNVHEGWGRMFSEKPRRYRELASEICTGG